MIRILVLDDNLDKVSKIREVIEANPEINKDSIHFAYDLIQARDACRQNLYDLLILDLRLPNRTGDKPDDLAGCEFIKELNASKTLLRPFHIIGLSAFDETLEKADKFFQEEVWRVIKYDGRSNGWRQQLQGKIAYLLLSKQSLNESRSNRFIFDVGIVTALHLPELQSILDLPAEWKETLQPNDPTIYYRGTFKNEQKRLSVVSCSANQMGMPASAVIATKIINWFRPKYLIISGIAAGIKGGPAKLGDILIASQSWDYESGKHKIKDGKHVFEPDPKSIPVSVDLKEKLLHAHAQKLFVAEIEAAWRGNKPNGLQTHVGPIASGAAVIQDSGIVEAIKNQSRKVIGLDMETYGMFYAAENCSMPRPIPLAFKAVCDYADADKTDEHQAYASFTSARFLYHFCLWGL